MELGVSQLFEFLEYFRLARARILNASNEVASSSELASSVIYVVNRLGEQKALVIPIVY